MRRLIDTESGTEEDNRVRKDIQADRHKKGVGDSSRWGDLEILSLAQRKDNRVKKDIQPDRYKKGVEDS